MTEAGMRSTENVRGEWDELGKRETRAAGSASVLGGAPGEIGAEAVPAPERYGSGLPGLRSEPEAESKTEVGVGGTEDDGIPADLGPAMDAMAEAGPPAPAPADLDLGTGPAPGVGWDPEPVVPGPAGGPEPVAPEPVRGPERLHPEPVRGPAAEAARGALPPLTPDSKTESEEDVAGDAGRENGSAPAARTPGGPAGREEPDGPLELVKSAPVGGRWFGWEERGSASDGAAWRTAPREPRSPDAEECDPLSDTTRLPGAQARGAAPGERWWSDAEERGASPRAAGPPDVEEYGSVPDEAGLSGAEEGGSAPGRAEPSDAQGRGAVSGVPRPAENDERPHGVPRPAEDEQRLLGAPRPAEDERLHGVPRAADGEQRPHGVPRAADGDELLRTDDDERSPVTLTVGAADPVVWWGAGRRQPVISTDATAAIPVHLLFRDDVPGGTPPGPGGGGGGARWSGDRRPPLPRSPQGQGQGQGQVQGPPRSAPHADPRLTERPGPVLPGWAALSAAATWTAGGLAVLWWHGVLPAGLTGALGLGVRPHAGIGTGGWALLALLVTLVLFTCCGLGRGRAGHASVLTLFGDYRGSVRRTGLLWISPLLRRRRIDVRLRHWRSEPLPAVDASGTALRAVVLVVWRVKDTVRAALGVADHERYLRDQVESALARVLSQLPADAFHEDTRTLRDAEAVGDALTRMLKADCVPVGIEVYSAQPTGIEYAPEVAAAMRRCRVAAIDAKHRDGVLTSVVDAVDDTVGRLTARGIVELDAYEHKALVRDLTVAFYTGRGSAEGV
ncbi:SPFH domain-containing protein [Streptomyces sp. NPDC058008]|uniref:SPFH domain-containing protein n=1 Tax=Streptomyces sp. NPDC058008 TaxID=3346303 RepID=UPI0036E94CBB